MMFTFLLAKDYGKIDKPPSFLLSSISGDEAVFNATDENPKSEAPTLQNSQQEIENAI